MLSIIIPAFNKAKVIFDTLTGLSKQSLPFEDYEVIVVDDGSTDETVSTVTSFDPPFRLSLITQANQGAAAARNYGTNRASGTLLVFLDADIIASPDLLMAHRQAHERHERSLVVGRILQWDTPGETSIHRIYTKKFDLGSQEASIPFGVGITGNLSIKKENFKLVGGFNPEFPRGQDIEFTYRAELAGLKLLYQPAAVAYHNHQLSFTALCKKARRDHFLLGPLMQKHPEFIHSMPYLQDKLPIDWRKDNPRMIVRKAARSILAFTPILSGMKHSCILLDRLSVSPRLLRFFVWKVIGSYERQGLREGMKKYGWEQAG